MIKSKHNETLTFASISILTREQGRGCVIRTQAASLTPVENGLHQNLPDSTCEYWCKCSCMLELAPVFLLSVCVTQLSGVTSNTPTHTFFTGCINLPYLRCLWAFNIHLSGISFSLSLVPYDRPTEVSVRLLLLIWYFCCQSTSWSLPILYPRH